MAEYTIQYGRNVTMGCNVLSTPPHSLVYWEKNTSEQTFLINAGFVGIQGVVPDNPSLTIEYATLSDSAMYTCFAKNIVGIGRSSVSSNLTVVGCKFLDPFHIYFKVNKQNHAFNNYKKSFKTYCRNRIQIK